MKWIVIVTTLVFAGCASTWTGYWPRVQEPNDAKYQADVRDCQTITLYGTTRAKVDACMEKRGYHVISRTN